MKLVRDMLFSHGLLAKLCFLQKKNKFVQKKMRPKEGTKIELQRDLSDFVRFVRFSGLDLSDLSDFPIYAILKKRKTDGPTDGPTDGRTDPFIEMRGRI